MYLERNSLRALKVGSLYTTGYKKQFYLREISRLTEIPLKSTQTLLKSLERNNILKSKMKGKNKYFRLNLENIQTSLFLLQSEIYKTSEFLEKYPQFKSFLKSLKFNIPLIVFGSFAKMTANKNSDLDLLIVSKIEGNLPFHLIPHEIHEVRLGEEAFLKALEKEEDLVKEVEENHIILNNHSFYVNTLWDFYGK